MSDRRQLTYALSQTSPESETSLGHEVKLMNRSTLVCRGVTTQQKHVHGRGLNPGWVAVRIQDVISKEKVEPWREYPAHSGEVEAGSFIAWPTEYISPKQSVETLQCAGG